MSDAIPLPPSPNLEQYKKQSKELLRASNDDASVRAWATRWLTARADAVVETEARLRGEESRREFLDTAIDRLVQRVRQANIRQLSDAQFFIARAHGFESWPKFARHINALQSRGSDAVLFEAAADAIVSGDVAALTRLLTEDPKLAHARSGRSHRSTLLHYTSANGIEDFRQKTPPNILDIARLLLDRGADVNAESDAYAGHSTTLMLVATSAHPRRAGLQIGLMELLMARGASIDRTAGAAIHAAMANGCRDAAALLADRGAPLDLLTAAALGRLNAVDRFLDDGSDIRAADRNGMTPLHWAASEGHGDVVRLLIEHGAPLESTNTFGGTVLGQTVWSAIHDRRPGQLDVIRLLVASGAIVSPDWFTGPSDVAAALQSARDAAEVGGGTQIYELRRTAAVARREGRLADAARDYAEAVELCRTSSDPLLLAHTVRHLGDVEMEMVQLDRARPHLEEAVSIYRSVASEPLAFANALRSLALLNERSGGLIEAKTLWQEAHELYVRANVPPGIAESAEHVAALT